MVPRKDDEPGEGEQTLSAGEVGAADGTAGVHGAGEVVIGEIPAADDPTTILWTARCSEADHDLLGHFGTREEAEAARAEHLASAHGGIAT
jgi:hypothetical protein